MAEEIEAKIKKEENMLMDWDLSFLDGFESFLDYDLDPNSFESPFW